MRDFFRDSRHPDADVRVACSRLGDRSKGLGRGCGAAGGEVLDGAALVARLWLSWLVAVSGGVGIVTTVVASLGRALTLDLGLVAIPRSVREVAAVVAGLWCALALNLWLVAVAGEVQSAAVVTSLGRLGRGWSGSVGRGKAVGRGVVETATGVANNRLGLASSAGTSGLGGTGWVLVARRTKVASDATVVAHLAAAVGGSSSVNTFSRAGWAISGEMASLLAVVALSSGGSSLIGALLRDVTFAVAVVADSPLCGSAFCGDVPSFVAVVACLGRSNNGLRALASSVLWRLAVVAQRVLVNAAGGNMAGLAAFVASTLE